MNDEIELPNGKTIVLEKLQDGWHRLYIRSTDGKVDHVKVIEPSRAWEIKALIDQYTTEFGE